jgi:thymidylate synthase
MFIVAQNLAKGVFEALKRLDEAPNVVEGENQSNKEILLERKLVMRIYQPLDTEYPIPKCIAGGLDDLADYVAEMLKGTKDGDFTYTYHELYSPYLDKMREEINRYRYTRRATLPIAGEKSYGTPYPPCLQLILPRIVKEEHGVDRMDLTVVFRSNDAVNAFPMNAFALAMMQKALAEEFGCDVGEFVYIANSFHCYAKDWGKLRQYVNRYTNAQADSDYGITMEEYEEWV